MPLCGIFLVDLVVTGAAAWLLVCASGHGRHGLLETGLAWCWSCVALVAGAGVVLGVTGGFGATGFLALHAAALAALALGRRRQLAEDRIALGLAGRQARQFFSTPGPDRLIALGLLVILAALALVAALAEPSVLDALTYHLPRIGHWLQDGKIRALATPDARLNFVADLPDIVWAWLMGCLREGFRPAILAQAFGGGMALGATVGLARESGLGRGAALLAGGLLLGMANVAVQFTSAQTDLFTTGVFAASFYLWLVALRRGEGSWLAGLGAGLALGAKGTLFYLAPSAVLWVAWLAWQHRLPWGQWRRVLLAGAIGIAFFAGPAFLRNWSAYGGFLGPAPWVKKHHQGFDSVSGQLHKIYWNLTSSLAQNLEPQSQPDGLRALSGTASQALARQLPAKDPYTLAGLDRHTALGKILERTEPDADVASFGAVTLLLFLVGAGVAVFRWRHGSGRLAGAWGAGVLLFFLFFHFMHQWHPFAFRYFVLVAPWVAVVSAWGLEQLGGRWRLAAWILVAACTLDVGWRATTHTLQAGWRTIASPERSLTYFVTMQWREWSQQLDHPATPYLLALPEERPIAAFYRQWSRREVAFQADSDSGAITAEEFVRGAGGWVIVPAVRFLGREGRVAASVWLLAGDEANEFSVAAYRSLGPGEKPAPIIYRQRRTQAGNSLAFSLLVKTVAGTATRLALTNPTAVARGYAWSTPLAHHRGTLAAGEKTVVTLPMPAEAVGEISVVFDPATPPAAGSSQPTADLLR